MTPRAVAVWWLRHRFELDRMSERLTSLAFDAPGDPQWRSRLDAARHAVASAVRVADERAIAAVPDELERRALRDELRIELAALEVAP